MGQDLDGRAAVFAALGEPVRLALVDRLVTGDASPGELAADVGLGSNLLAHHLRVLEDASIIRRVRSEGDRRRSYVQLRLDQPTVWAAAISGRMPNNLPTGPRVLFVCTANSARSQLAAAIWNQLSTIPATSAGTHPGPRIHPRAIAVAERHGLRIERNRPEPLDEVLHDDDLIVAVCDNAHEELGTHPSAAALVDSRPSANRYQRRLRARLHRHQPSRPPPRRPLRTSRESIVTTPTWSTLSIDTALALRTAASRLAEEFTGTFGTETIERFLHSSYDQLAQQAAVTKFLPLMAERFARQRLRAVAKVEGLHRDGKPTVLFLCTHNAGRSQMALGFFEALTGDHAVAWSGGSEPGHEVNPAAIAAMAERGIDISSEFPKPWTDETVRAADVVITMGCGDACPIFPGKRYESWDDLDDPAGLDTPAVRPIRDDIERRVRQLIDELGLTPAGDQGLGRR